MNYDTTNTLDENNWRTRTITRIDLKWRIQEKKAEDDLKE